MVFSSLPFLFLFLTVVLLVSHILPFRFRNFFLLLAFPFITQSNAQTFI